MGYFANKEAQSTPPIIACYCKGGCDSRSDVTAELERLFLSLLRAGEREEGGGRSDPERLGPHVLEYFLELAVAKGWMRQRITSRLETSKE
jgi:hypothetical protein